ncbi:MAG TPA: histidine--tRNA ligase [Patescibacteria group bacterium]
MSNVQTLKGFRDFLPQEKRKRDFVREKVVEVFERFGFEPLETPTLEYASLLLGKYGDEADKLVYTFEDNGGRKVGLRYDQTVPTARVLAQYVNELPRYFRRYQIQNVFRADKPQKGRYREFTQCDIDIFGSISPIADAEILACTYFSYKNVGFSEVILKINDRQTLFKTFEKFAKESVSVFSIIQSIDKLDKQSVEEVIAELVNKGLSQTEAEEVLLSVQNAKLSENLQEIIKQAIALGVPESALQFTSSLARGLDYYTGMIFEVIIPQYPVGSCGGGGRYDKLIEDLGGKDVAAVGIAFGFDRMVEAAEALNLYPQEIYQSAKVFVTIFNKDLQEKSEKIAAFLRSRNINTEIFVGEVTEKNQLDKQLKYADAKKIPYVVIIGPEEAEKNIVTLKNLSSRTQQSISVDKLPDLLNTK